MLRDVRVEDLEDVIIFGEGFLAEDRDVHEDLQPEMKERVVEYWSNVAPELGDRVAEGLGVEVSAATR